MKRSQIINFVCSVCSYLWLSQSKTLSQLVAATTKASLSEIGRTLSYQNHIATKYCIKPIDRFTGNHRIEPIEAMRGIVETEPNVYVKAHGFTGKLSDLPIAPSQHLVLHNVSYMAERRRQAVVSDD